MTNEPPTSVFSRTRDGRSVADEEIEMCNDGLLEASVPRVKDGSGSDNNTQGQLPIEVKEKILPSENSFISLLPLPPTSSALRQISKVARNVSFGSVITFSEPEEYYRRENSGDGNGVRRYIDDNKSANFSIPKLPRGMSIPEHVTERDFSDGPHIRKLSLQISKSWGTATIQSVEVRIRNFFYAQNRRKQKYGETLPWGIMSMHQHLDGIRTDIKWSQDAAWRSSNNQQVYSWGEWDSQNNSCFVYKPFFTLTVMMICTLSLIISFYKNGWFIESMKVNPMIGPSQKTLLEMGAKETSLILGGEWWRVISCMFLHAGVIHYMFNMVALWFVGSAIEHNFGLTNVAILFLLPDIFGTLLSCIFLPEHPSVGASGGIFGLVGATLADICTNWSLLFSKRVNVDSDSTYRHVLIVVFLLFDITLNCAIGLTPFIDNFTHLGGLVLGFLCGLSVNHHDSGNLIGIHKGILTQICERFVKLLGIIVSLAAVVIAFLLLAASDGHSAPCPKCQQLSCIPFPFWVDDDKRWWNCDYL